MLFPLLAVVGGTALALGLSSRLLRDAPLTEPLAALLIGVLIGPHVLGAVDDAAVTTEVIGTVALVVLAASVTSAALRHPTDDVAAVVRPVALLLVVALPFMALASAASTAIVVGIPLASAAVLGTALAPTDPVLTSNAVTGDAAKEQIPARIRTMISIESGSNDGVATGFVLVSVAVAVGADVPREIVATSFNLAASVALGATTGWIVGRLLVASERHHDIEHTAFLVLTLSLVALVLGVSEIVGGESVLAVFSAALAYAHVIPSDDRRDEWEVQEAVNRYLVLPVFTLLGVALPWAEWADLGWSAPVVVVAIHLSRRLPIVLALRRPLGTSRSEATLLAWTGPVGIGSLYLASLAVSNDGLDARIWPLATLVVAASVVTHGLTASAVRRLAASSKGSR